LRRVDRGFLSRRQRAANDRFHTEPQSKGAETMPAKTEKQRKFMGAELQRKREGKKTRTDMSEKELEKFASKPGRKKELGDRPTLRFGGAG
jgi:hypothetical protein